MKTRLYQIAITTLLALLEHSAAFSARHPFGHYRKVQDSSLTWRLQSSYVGEGSEYSSNKNDFDDDEDKGSGFDRGFQDQDEDETPTIELKPVPLSKNAGSRFVALIWDRELDTEGKDPLDLHHDRVPLTEDHVMFCRKTSLYNETFNTESMVDILWSLPM